MCTSLEIFEVLKTCILTRTIPSSFICLILCKANHRKAFIVQKSAMMSSSWRSLNCGNISFYEVPAQTQEESAESMPLGRPILYSIRSIEWMSLSNILYPLPDRASHLGLYPFFAPEMTGTSNLMELQQRFWFALQTLGPSS